MKAESAHYPVVALCRVMRVSKSAFYEWLNRRPSKRALENEVLRKEIREAFDAKRGTYGRRRIAAEINTGKSEEVSVNRVSRRMGELKIAGYTPPSFKKTTIPDIILEDSPNLVGAAQAQGVNEIWVSDLTYVATKEGWLFLCVIIDLFSRKVVGWSARNNMKVDILLDAFDKAVRSRRPNGPVIFHSDKGGQYKAKKFRRRLKRLGFQQSMTGVNHCYDNPFAESFFGTLKTELIRGKIFQTRQEAEVAMFEYIEVFYNRVRLHSSLDYRSPETFEEEAA